MKPSPATRRITAATTASATYTLDPVGNRTSANSTFSGFSPVAGSYNADDQLSSETYDANGNTTLAANGNSYTYDSENHMTSATGNGKTITMVYDAFGNRVGEDGEQRHHQRHDSIWWLTMSTPPACRRWSMEVNGAAERSAGVHLRVAAHQPDTSAQLSPETAMDAELLRLRRRGQRPPTD
jgi:YD repeat-containing protein